MSSSSATLPLEDSRRPGTLDRILSLAAPVRAGEAAGALLLALNVFLLLGTYYILKTVREPLILGQPGGAEVKSYASAGQALLFLIVVPIYSAVASRFHRMKLIAAVTLFFVSNLVLFYLMGTAGASVGIAFFLWVGIFNMLIVAQFWAFANDLYTEEAGKRLFPVVGVGASLGAWVGAMLAKQLAGMMGVFEMMLVAAALLAACVGLTWLVNARESARSAAMKKPAELPMDKAGGFQLVIKDKYLRLIAMLVLVFNAVNTLGEYLLGRFVSEQALLLPKADQKAFIGQFYGDYFSWVNLIGFLLQVFLVSRLFQWIGVRGALFVLPLIAMGGYAMLAAMPVLGIVRWAKIFENSTDYSLNNTVRHALFLPTSREAKYKGKAATDTFFVRAGDMLQAGIVYLGARVLGWTVANFAVLNLVLVAVWLGICVLIFREHKKISGSPAA